jgi:hypothetical protein
MPVMDIVQAKTRRQAIIDFTKSIMVEEVDYGVIPGTGGKPTLKKPGAEKLTSLFGLSPRFEIAEKVLDWTGDEHSGEPFFYLQYRCSLWYGDNVAGEGLGSCNSWEKKYRYRKAERVCPNCGKDAIKKSKYPPRNNPAAKPGWYCFAKAGGCGAEFPAGDPTIEQQEAGQIRNDNPADLVNTIDKMAQKRALVAATLIAVNASEFFTQDVEDMDFGNVVEGDFVEEKAQPAAPPKNGNTQNGNGRKQPPPAPDDIVEGHYEPAVPEPPRNGNGKSAYSEDETLVFSAASNFLPTVCRTIPFYTSATVAKEAMKKLGYSGIPGKAEDAHKRVVMYRTLNEYAELVAAGLPDDLAIGVVNGVITLEEAQAQLAAAS